LLQLILKTIYFFHKAAEREGKENLPKTVEKRIFLLGCEIMCLSVISNAVTLQFLNKQIPFNFLINT